MINISLKDGSQRTYEEGATLMKICEDISRGLARNTLAAVFNGEITDLNTPVYQDGKV
ncbi:MAG TPA: hypothetical protein DD811_01650, partial [Syntrophomonas sp.]|nr:hypothetical protein [Syntrophomonas sp.]